MKNSNDTSWDRTSDLPILSTELRRCERDIIINFDVLLSLHLSLFLVTDQLNAHILVL